MGIVNVKLALREQVERAIVLLHSSHLSEPILAASFLEELENLKDMEHKWYLGLHHEAQLAYIALSKAKSQADKQDHKYYFTEIGRYERLKLEDEKLKREGENLKRKGELLEREASFKRSKGP